MAKILVLGSSGYIGTHLVPGLVQAGHSVRAASRNREVLIGRNWENVEITETDILSGKGLDEAVRDIDVIYYLVHSMASGKDYAEKDRQAATNVREAASRHQVQRIVYLGGLQPVGAASEHLSSRAETGDTLRKGNIAVTELRAGIIVGPGSAGFEVIRDLVNHLRVMITPRWVQSSTQPIALDDLLHYLIHVIDTQETLGEIYDVGGPEILTYEEMMRTYAKEIGRPLNVIRAPVLTTKLSSYWLGFVTAVPSSIARPLIDGLKWDLLADNTSIQELLPRKLHNYRESLRAAMEAERNASLSVHWASAALPYPGFGSEESFFSKQQHAQGVAKVSVNNLWDEVIRIGGLNGWYAYSWLWRVRGILDRILGGPGMRRRRRHAEELRVGDVLDFWRVVRVEPESRLTLLAEMKLPGRAILEFQLEPINSQSSRLRTVARFHPRGILGLIYWYVLLPLHPRIFNGITKILVKKAEAKNYQSSTKISQ